MVAVAKPDRDVGDLDAERSRCGVTGKHPSHGIRHVSSPVRSSGNRHCRSRGTQEERGGTAAPLLGLGDVSGYETGLPVAGLRMNGVSFACVQLNSPFRLPATASKDPPPMRGTSQLSSMNRRIEV